MSASLPAPHAGLIRHFRNATVTRSVIARKERIHIGAVYDADGALARELNELDRALEDRGCPKPGPVGRILNLVDR